MTMSQKFSCASGHWYVRLRSMMLTRAVLAIVEIGRRGHELLLRGLAPSEALVKLFESFFEATLCVDGFFEVQLGLVILNERLVAGATAVQQLLEGSTLARWFPLVNYLLFRFLEIVDSIKGCRDQARARGRTKMCSVVIRGSGFEARMDRYLKLHDVLRTSSMFCNGLESCRCKKGTKKGLCLMGIHCVK